MQDGRDDSGAVIHAARTVLKAAQDLARQAGNPAERRCFESLARRIQLEILAAKGDPDRLARIAPSSQGTSIVALILKAGEQDAFELARATLKLWFWPDAPAAQASAVELPAGRAPCRCHLLI